MEASRLQTVAEHGSLSSLESDEDGSHDREPVGGRAKLAGKPLFVFDVDDSTDHKSASAADLQRSV